MAKARSIGHIKGHAALAGVARQALRARVADLEAWSAYVDRPDAMAELHNMRIASKRLRYSLELLQAGLGPTALPLLDAVQEMQEMLGAIHDADVLSEMLRRQIAITSLREGLDLAGKIITFHGAVKKQRALQAESRGLYALLTIVAARRDEHYQAFRAWWAAHTTLLAELAALAAEAPAMEAAATLS